jgi:large subunit ribosomal protein L37Ae
MATKRFGSVKRFGPRYGRTLKDRLSVVEQEQKKNHRCPYCTYDRVRQLTVGIFLCTKCGSKFASKAFTVAKVASIKTQEELA